MRQDPVISDWSSLHKQDTGEYWDCDSIDTEKMMSVNEAEQMWIFLGGAMLILIINWEYNSSFTVTFLRCRY